MIRRFPALVDQVFFRLSLPTLPSGLCRDADVVLVDITLDSVQSAQYETSS